MQKFFCENSNFEMFAKIFSCENFSLYRYMHIHDRDRPGLPALVCAPLPTATVVECGPVRVPPCARSMLCMMESQAQLKKGATIIKYER